MTDRRLAVDLITFCHPGYWGVKDTAAVGALCDSDPKAFWDRMLDAIAGSGVTGVECTFGPFSYKTALKAYGSVPGIRAELNRRGLTMISGFLSGFDRHGDLEDAAVRAAICAEAAAYAEVLGALGGHALVAGLPMRHTKGEQPAQFVDLDLARPLARLLNEIGAAIAPHGIALALHTESHSVMCTARDVDLFMLLTDPLYVGLCPDSAHLTLSGADPVAVLARHRDRLVTSHWKDASGPMPLDVPIDDTIHQRHQPYFRDLGHGCVDWPAWAALHKAPAYPGWNILEVDATPDPVKTITDGRRFVEQDLAQFMA